MVFPTITSLTKLQKYCRGYVRFYKEVDVFPFRQNTFLYIGIRRKCLSGNVQHSQKLHNWT